MMDYLFFNLNASKTYALKGNYYTGFFFADNSIGSFSIDAGESAAWMFSSQRSSGSFPLPLYLPLYKLTSIPLTSIPLRYRGKLSSWGSKNDLVFHKFLPPSVSLIHQSPPLCDQIFMLSLLGLVGVLDRAKWTKQPLVMS
jgi:hypothetical protein